MADISLCLIYTFRFLQASHPSPQDIICWFLGAFSQDTHFLCIVYMFNFGLILPPLDGYHPKKCSASRAEKMLNHLKTRLEPLGIGLNLLRKLVILKFLLKFPKSWKFGFEFRTELMKQNSVSVNFSICNVIVAMQQNNIKKNMSRIHCRTVHHRRYKYGLKTKTNKETSTLAAAFPQIFLQVVCKTS